MAKLKTAKQVRARIRQLNKQLTKLGKKKKRPKRKAKRRPKRKAKRRKKAKKRRRR